MQSILSVIIYGSFFCHGPEILRQKHCLCRKNISLSYFILSSHSHHLIHFWIIFILFFILWSPSSRKKVFPFWSELNSSIGQYHCSFFIWIFRSVFIGHLVRRRRRRENNLFLIIIKCTCGKYRKDTAEKIKWNGRYIEVDVNLVCWPKMK